MAAHQINDPYGLITSAGVLIVAGIAAVISFEHISTLALKYGQPVLAAYLMPISVDGLVTVSSLAMLRAARSEITTIPALARSGLVLGVTATLAANVAYGLPHGPIGALISGWPAVAFIVAAEIAIGLVRRKPATMAAELSRLGVAVPVSDSHPAAALSRPESHQLGSAAHADAAGSHRGVAGTQPCNAAATADLGISESGTGPWDALAAAQTKTEAIRVALAECGPVSAPEVVSWLSERGWNVNAALVRSVRSRDTGSGAATDDTARRESGAAITVLGAA